MSILLDIKTGDPEDAGARYQLAGYAEAFNKSVDALDFDPVEHVYRLKETGDAVPSVTQILRATGISTDFDELRSFGSKFQSAIDRKRDIGREVHAAAHYYDDDDLNWNSLDPDVKPYLEAWATFRQNFPHLLPATRERMVYHPALRYAGTLDGIFVTDSGDLNQKIEITGRWSVQLTPGRKVPYRVTAYDDFYTDVEIWKSIVTTYWAQAARRKAA